MPRLRRGRREHELAATLVAVFRARVLEDEQVAYRDPAEGHLDEFLRDAGHGLLLALEQHVHLRHAAVYLVRVSDDARLVLPRDLDLRALRKLLLLRHARVREQAVDRRTRSELSLVPDPRVEGQLSGGVEQISR